MAFVRAEYVDGRKQHPIYTGGAPAEPLWIVAAIVATCDTCIDHGMHRYTRADYPQPGFFSNAPWDDFKVTCSAGHEERYPVATVMAGASR